MYTLYYGEQVAHGSEPSKQKQQLDGYATENAPRHDWRRVVYENSLLLAMGGILAFGTMAVFTIYLRRRGSPESKPVGAPREETGSFG
jgi:hypothetical protein